MKHSIKLLLGLFMLVATVFTSCKKNAETPTDFALESSTHSDDQSRVSNEVDALANDFNTIVDNYVSFTGREANILALPCDVTVAVDSTSNPRRITITYNGSTCNPFRTRTGVVVITMPSNMRWRDVGAVLTVSIQNLKITRTIDNKSITINGTKTIKNVTGGIIRNLATLGTITHEISSSNMTLTFDNNTQRSWQIAKKRVFTFNNGIVITTTGNATVDGLSGVAEWGTNRFGNTFITTITQPMVIKQDCNFRLTSGQVTHNRLQATLVVTFGLDAAGNPTSCPGLGLYYFKLVYTGSNGVVRTVIIPY